MAEGPSKRMVSRSSVDVGFAVVPSARSDGRSRTGGRRGATTSGLRCRTSGAASKRETNRISTVHQAALVRCAADRPCALRLCVSRDSQFGRYDITRMART